jgi:hypothetical protein
VSLLQDARHSGTYKYPRTVPLRGEINRAIATPSQNLVHVAFIPPLDQLAQESKFQQRAGPRYGTRLSGYTGSGPPQETSVHSLVPDPRLSDPQDL